MARLHEHQGKALLKAAGLATPRGDVASTPEDAARIAREIGGPTVLKIQAWTTGRKALGGVAFADTPDEAAAHAERLLAMRVGAFPVTEVLVEEKLPITHEIFASLTIDDAARAPVLLLSLTGGTGIEDRAKAVARLACTHEGAVEQGRLQELLAASPIPASMRTPVADAIATIVRTARTNEARSLEVNPLVVTSDGRVLAADCRVTIDDYAVFRHPELGIDIARELDHPPTILERIAYAVEEADHRGTFYFAVMNTEAAPDSKGLIGFHGAGGGGSMMSMDAVTNEGFTVANFCDTSGNPSAAKVYRAARIILSQSGLVGYFGSGSGVASQEQFWSAYGLAKAFWELDLDIPALIRLGGNSEDRAVEILQDATRDLRAPVEGYKKDDPPRFIAERFAKLVAESKPQPWRMRSAIRRPDLVSRAEKIELEGATLFIDQGALDDESRTLAERHSMGVLKADSATGKLIPSVPRDQLSAKDSELIACEVELRRAGKPVVFLQLSIPILDEEMEELDNALRESDRIRDGASF